MLSAAKSPGINVLAPFSQPSSLCESALSVVRALDAAGVSTACFDSPVGRKPSPTAPLSAPVPEPFDITLLHEPADIYFDLCYLKAGLVPRRSVHRIGLWYCEAEELPAEWSQHAARLDEFWAPTEFVAAAMRRSSSLPVRRFLPSVRLAEFAPCSRSALGLPEGRFIFLFMFDMVSGIPRKNPLGLMRAFARAFRPEEPVSLVLKLFNGSTQPAEMRAVRQAAAETNAIIIDRRLSRGECLAMVAACDAYVSLHRAEGLGLTMAEAMLLGKPTIATGYSGNLDFMTPDNSLLVDWTPGIVREFRPPFKPGQRWAEPSLDHAARQMRWVYDHPPEAQALGRRGQQEALRSFDSAATGRAMAARLAEIQAGPPIAARQPGFAVRAPLGWNSRVGSLGHGLHRLFRQHGIGPAARRLWYECRRRAAIGRPSV